MATGEICVNKATSVKCCVCFDECGEEPPSLLTCLHTFCSNCIDTRRSSADEEKLGTSSPPGCDVTGRRPARVTDEKSSRDSDAAAGSGSTGSASVDGKIQIGGGIDAELRGCGSRDAGEGLNVGSGVSGVSGPTSASSTCEVCGDVSGNVARVMCVECRQKLCGTCSASCWKRKGGPPHQLLRLEGALVSCGSHGGNGQNWRTANGSNECKASNVQGRRGSRILTPPDAAAIQFLEHVRHEADVLSQIAVETRQQRTRLETVRHNLLERTSTEQETIRRKGDQIKSWIDERVNAMLARVDAFRNRKVKEIDVRSTGLEHTAVVLETFVGYTKQAVDTGAILQFGVTATELFKARIAELKRTAGVAYDPCSVPDIRFVAAEDAMDEKADAGFVKKLLGELMVGEEVEHGKMESRGPSSESDTSTEVPNCSPNNDATAAVAETTSYSARHNDAASESTFADASSQVPCLPTVPFLQSTMTTTSCVRGVAECSDKLYVVCDQSDTIFSFELHTFDPSTNLRVAGLKEPKDLVACSVTKHLFIAENGCVWRVALETGDAVKWLTDVVSMTTRIYPFALSVTSRQQVLLTTGSDELLLYGGDGEQLECISSPELNGLRHAVETPRGTYYVINLWPQPQVSEVDVEGRVLRIYNDQQTLNYPCRLELASDGRLFVADFINHRVLLLNGQLELERVLLDVDSHRLAGYPLRMCYQRGSEQLVVASGLQCVVQVFSIN